MSRIVFAWELGANYGYISQFLPFARELKRRGHEVLLVLRELHHAERVISDTDIPVLQAPLWLPSVSGFPEPPLSYAEILLRYGYHDVQALAGVVSAWRALLMLVGPHLVIASHAPTALLACRSLGIPAASLGTGFTCPPMQTPLPKMRHWLQVPEGRLESSEKIITSTINQILTGCGKSPLPALQHLFDLKENFLCTLPELDHYPMRGQSRYWGPVFDTEMGESVAWPIAADTDKRLLVYMEPHHRDFPALMEAIAALDLVALVCAPGISDGLRNKYTSQRLIISNKPLKFSPLIDRCDLVVCHGGHGTAAGMLKAGLPLLLFPNHLEQFLLASQVKAMGAGELVNLENPAPNLTELLPSILANKALRQNAQAFSKKYASQTSSLQLQSIVNRIEEIAKA